MTYEIITAFMVLLSGSGIIPNQAQGLITETPTSIQVYADSVYKGRQEKYAEGMTDFEKSEVLWLARIIFSETKKLDEMRSIGWVVRNRVEDRYRGSTYKEVAQSAHQFSGLNKGDAQYHVNINLDYNAQNTIWRYSLAVAREVYFAPSSARPFSKDVKHFYSPSAVGQAPKWTDSGILDHTIPEKYQDTPRFAFYRDVR